MQNKGLSSDEFKKVAPNLFQKVVDSFKNKKPFIIYGMNIKLRDNGLDEIMFVKNIDERTPLYAHKICKDKYQQDRYEMFFPN
jgi:hypothetical protein